MYKERICFYKKIEELRNSKVIAYVTGDRPGMETQIGSDVIDLFAEHLDQLFKKSDKISLLLYSNGGSVGAAWNLVNLIRMFCDKFEVIIPRKAHSAATLISIGADKIVMTKQATLGPIDPSVGSPYNPTINNTLGQTISLPVSVEDVAGFFELAANEMKADADMRIAFQSLVQNIHPLALGQVARSRAQIKTLAEKLLKNHMTDEKQINRIISFLCSESGSHDYTINRREAKQYLGLPIENASEELYPILKLFYQDICDEMKLKEPFTLPSNREPMQYNDVKALIESVEGGSDQYRSQGMAQIMRGGSPDGQMLPGPQVIDQRIKEGWMHESAK